MPGTHISGPLTVAGVEVVDSSGAVTADIQATAGSIDTAELADNAVTLAKMAGGTAGNIITFDASGDPAAVTTGTSGQVLTSNGAGLAPTFQAASSGPFDASDINDSDGTGGNYIQKFALAVYDFAVDGGATGTITLTDNATVPDNAICALPEYEVITTFTSATDAATIAFQLQTDGVLIDAVAISDASNPWDAGIEKLGIGQGRKTTASRQFQVVIATENLTAGKAIFKIPYFVTE